MESKGKNRLFLVCTHCQLERSIREEYDEWCYFLTPVGGNLNFSDTVLMDQVKFLIHFEQIDEINLVVDSTCDFFNATRYSCESNDEVEILTEMGEVLCCCGIKWEKHENEEKEGGVLCKMSAVLRHELEQSPEWTSLLDQNGITLQLMEFVRAANEFNTVQLSNPESRV